MEGMEGWVGQIQSFIALYGLKVLAAIVIFVVGRWVARLLTKTLKKMMRKGNVDETLVKFIGNMTYIALLTFVILAALGKLGVQTTSFIAVIGAAGLAVGLALQGSLSNFAAGVLMIIFRPFKVGDYIDAAGVSGTVEKIEIFTTQLKTPDNKTVIIPNSKITEGPITNVTAKDTRRVDLIYGVGYSDDIDKVKEVLVDILAKDARVLDDPPPIIGLLELADSSVNFAVRPWVKKEDYWNFYFDMNESVKKRFDSEGISIPFPQRDVHMINQT